MSMLTSGTLVIAAICLLTLVLLCNSSISTKYLTKCEKLPTLERGDIALSISFSVSASRAHLCIESLSGYPLSRHLMDTGVTGMLEP